MPCMETYGVLSCPPERLVSKIMRQLFGTTRYVNVGVDVLPNEEYLFLSVLNMWDFDNTSLKFYSDDFTYIVNITSRETNTDSYKVTRATAQDLDADEIAMINKQIS